MATVSQRSFAGGEIAPDLYARTDLDKYITSLRTARNGYILRQGGFANRAGTQFIAEVKDSSKQVRLIKFVFNDDQTYVLEFGDQYIRFYRNGVQLESGGSPYEIVSPYLEADLLSLNYDQSADVITITHPSYAPRELSRTGHTSWTLAIATFAPTQSAPTGLSVTSSGSSGSKYVVTAINDDDFEESLPSAEVESSATASSGTPLTISWTAAANATEYNVYKESNGVFGFIGVASGTSFVDDGIEADTTETAPKARNPFSTDFPSTSAYYQQRHLFANTPLFPERAEASKTAAYNNFSRSSPLQADDAFNFDLVSNQVNQIRHMITLRKLLILTSGGEWVIQGDDAGTLRPGEPNAEQISTHGSAALRPLIISTSALFLQSRQTVVRDIVNDSINGFSSDDLTIFSAHLFDDYTIIDWDYSEIPNSIVYAVRSDGTLLSFTIIRRQRMFAWTRNDTDGEFERVVSVPEGSEDVQYYVVKRTINGQTKRYIERSYTRKIVNIEDLVMLDSALSYDGRNTDTGHTMTLSGGSTWGPFETITLTSSTAYFSASDVGNEIHITDTDGTELRFRIEGYTSPTVVTGKPHKNVPSSLQATATSSWAKAVDELSGIDHLEGEAVGVFADGFVVASPNNEAYEGVTVASGAITLERPYKVIHVGLPYISDVETLGIDTTDGETLRDKDKLIQTVSIYVNETRGIFVGTKPPSDDTTDPLEGLYEAKIRDDEGYDDPVGLKTGLVKVRAAGTFNDNGRAFIRQIDPLPMTILNIMPSGYLPTQRVRRA